MENFALHFEGQTDDESAVTKAAERFAKSIGAKTAYLSTPRGTHDLTKDTLIDAVTEDGTKVKVRAPDRFVPFPTSFDPVPHQNADGEWQVEVEHQKYRRLSEDEVKALGQEPTKAAPKRRRRRSRKAPAAEAPAEA